jgi:hypothetical protein
MRTLKRPAVFTAIYLGIALLAIAYELSIRVYDTGNSEFAGMLSLLLTMPSSLLAAFIGKRGFGVNVGDSNFYFLVILGLAALANSLLVFIVARRFHSSAEK